VFIGRESKQEGVFDGKCDEKKGSDLEWKEQENQEEQEMQEEQEEIKGFMSIVVHLMGPTTMSDCFLKHNSPLGPSPDECLP
jgi:hypothetical protein